MGLLRLEYWRILFEEAYKIVEVVNADVENAKHANLTGTFLQ